MVDMTVLDEGVEVCQALVRIATAPLWRTIHRFDITYESRLIILDTAPYPKRESSETALIVRFVVEGPYSLVPVQWQAAGADDLIPRLQQAFHSQSLLTELRAAAEGFRLENAMDCAVVMDPLLAAMMIHECIGHTSEADNFIRYGQPNGLALGQPWCELPFQVFDDPIQPHHRGSYMTDDEGEAAHRTQLVKDGIWNALLHSHETMRLLDAPHAGNARRVVGARPPLPRMSVTYLDAGAAGPPEALIAQTGKGLYCGGAWGGGSMELNFVLRPSYGRWIRGGRLTNEFVRGFDLHGDKWSAMRQLCGISNDLTLFDLAFGCDKEGHNNLPITMGAPHLSFATMHLRPIAM